MIGIVWSWHGEGECKRVYAYRDDYRTKCFLRDGFKKCGYTTKFPYAELGYSPQALQLYVADDGYDCCDIQSLQSVGQVFIYYDKHSGKYEVKYELYGDKYGFKSFRVHIDADDRRYPRGPDGKPTIDFSYCRIKEDIDSGIVPYRKYDGSLHCNTHINIIATGVICSRYKG